MDVRVIYRDCPTCGRRLGQPMTRRRYDGLHAKAASTGLPEEADACRAETEQLRTKYGLRRASEMAYSSPRTNGCLNPRGDGWVAPL